MEFERQSGVFLHLTSLPGPHGIGDLGEGASEFLEFLARGEQSLWQFCPIGPTSGGHEHSPYGSYSAFAGNPLLIDLTDLVERGWLEAAEVDPGHAAVVDADAFDASSVNYGAVERFKSDRLRLAFDRFESQGPPDEFREFREGEADWLGNYALFAALKVEFDGAPWPDWPEPLVRREPEALAEYADDLADEVRYHEFVQWVFDLQWRELQVEAEERGIDLVGDVPIYVALDSADVWAHTDCFAVDETGHSQVVSGVPPNPGDDGQRWGSPVYDWDYLAETDYSWWLRRLERLFDLVDVARIDHFKAFDEFWAIPAEASSPAAGEWRDGPGVEFFEAARERLGDLPFVVEDLGFLDDGLIALRDHFGFPGMRVAEYADWCAESHMHKPGDYPTGCVGYTSTHDTDTVLGYYRDLDEEQRDCMHYALDAGSDDVVWSLLEAVWHSEATLAMTTVQDLLELGTEARLNKPGTAADNWDWRVQSEQLTEDVTDRLADVTLASVR